jgi:signal transduction histidine kinase
VLLLGDALGERTGAPLLATVVVALGAEPARQRVQRLVDRVTRGDRSDPYRALVDLGGRLEAAAAAPVGAEALRGVAEAVRHALRLPWVVVDVLDGPVASSGPAGHDGVELPLVHGGELVGHLVVGPRRPDRPLPAGDLRLLEDLARPVAVAAHAAHLRDALQYSRERLVTAREEERRRLRHDLHDDLGPVLAAVALQVGEVRSLVGDHPAAPLAARAEVLLTGAVATVRRIVDGLRPAALDELGLAEALHAAAEGFELGGMAVDVEIRGELRDLPAAVEVATLRIATEALSNAARHAGASQVRLGVERLPHALEVTVADDGRGLGAEPRAGVGLVSMRERAEELGGRCTVTRGAAGGTVVVATLPAPGVPADERVRG